MTATRAEGARDAVDSPESTQQVLDARRAVEALRSGVPSRTVVTALGSGQPRVDARFAALLDSTAGDTHQGGGLLLGGGFGAGKSHALEHLAETASARGFVVSRVVISKETPIFDPVRVLRAATETAVPPTEHGWRSPGAAVRDASALVQSDGVAESDLIRRVTSPDSGLDERFALSVALHARASSPELDEFETEVTEAVADFWRGGALRPGDIRKWIRRLGEPRPALTTVPAAELARQRLMFLPQLFRAAGWAGWVVLVDEVELIGRYSLLQRGRSYAALADLLGAPQRAGGLPLVLAFATTDDFEAAVLTGKKDRTEVPLRLRAKHRPEWDKTADDAVVGMAALTREVILLTPADDAELDRAYRSLKALHGRAYSWSPPDVPGLERLQATRMRQHVRAWINEWDLVRLDPDYEPVTQAGELATSYDEEPELEEDEVAPPEA